MKRPLAEVMSNNKIRSAYLLLSLSLLPSFLLKVQPGAVVMMWMIIALEQIDLCEVWNRGEASVQIGTDEKGEVRGQLPRGQTL